MGVTGPSRCRSCGEPLDAGDNYCGRCGADPLTSGGFGVPAGYGAPPAAAFAAGPAAQVGPPPPDPTTRLPIGDATAPTAPAAGGRPADPRVVGYEAVADAAAGTGPRAEAEVSPTAREEALAGAEAEPAADTATDAATADAPAPGEAAEPSNGTAEDGAAESGSATVAGETGTAPEDPPERQRDHLERELPGVAAVSDRGHRHHRNEDFFALGDTVLTDGAPAVIAVVCDGVSSATRPDDASKAAAERATGALRMALPRGTHPQQAMHDAVLAASAAVDALAVDPSIAHDEFRQQNAPACTIVGALVGGGLLTIGWVGDSRAYWIPDDRTAPPVRLTEDDSWAAQMVANNLMTEAEANADERAHAITGWLGADAYEVEPHVAAFRPDGPGTVVVCTDGLWNYAETAGSMAAVLPLDAPVRPLNAARVLVDHALDGGGHDNVTVAVVRFPTPGEGAGSA
ncbi:magnesium or manganese-dependent protein phosphatase [Streptomyces noursei ATCC 11455]|uniref:PP2C family serine/threonine-protein phosphatase n=1 Tax=Streptomyces noursei TaxID=1971 RepID=UPI00081C87E1|nr:magnesium or manganese-dependent protein phosphatase [Streptomyces noursei ATCC 11455]